MRVCLIGYGKMGRAIEEILLTRSHEVSGRIHQSNEDQLDSFLQKSDVAIEFTKPEAAAGHLIKCFENNVPVVCGTTGWLSLWNDVINKLQQHDCALLYASNFSVGVQLFFELNKKLTQLMSRQPEYECRIHEIHHTQKKDAPSGTAISLARDIISLHPNYKMWSQDLSQRDHNLPIISDRIDDVIGTHIISYSSPIDQIEIQHKAFNRKGFALGAVLAAEWIIGKKGSFTMQDVLGID